MHLPSVGSIVDVRRHGRATVLQHSRALAGPLESGRVQVQYHEDGSTRWVLPQTLRHMHLANRQVVVAGMTEDYRNAVIFNVERHDVCLEIGCHVGTTTLMLHKRCAFVVGLDTSSVIVNEARKRHPRVRFEVLDGGDVTSALALSPTRTFDKICIDISGKADLQLVAPLVHTWLSALPTAVIIVKNEALFGALEDHMHFVVAAVNVLSAAAVWRQDDQSDTMACSTDIAHSTCIAAETGSIDIAHGEAAGVHITSVSTTPERTAGRSRNEGASNFKARHVGAAHVMEGLWEKCELFLHKYNGEVIRSQQEGVAKPSRSQRRAARRQLAQVLTKQDA